jgi:hypothetical protein
LEIIMGRHRLDSARRTGENTIPAQIVREPDGFTREVALVFDAEANIRDGQGEVRDYAHNFRHARISEAAAVQRGLLSRASGRDGWALGVNASDDLHTTYRNKAISEKAAVAIATIAPQDTPAQRVGIRFSADNARAHHQDVGNAIQAPAAPTAQPTQEVGLFGETLPAQAAPTQQGGVVRGRGRDDAAGNTGGYSE